MKNSDLIDCLSHFNGDLEVTTSNKKGIFQDIKSVELQTWKSNGKDHASITLIIGGNDKQKTLFNENNKTIFEVELDNSNEEFIDSVNENLLDSDKINKQEALSANKVFEYDKFTEMQKKYQKFFIEKYDGIRKEVMFELFGSDKPIASKDLKDLKLHIYENGWQNELSGDEMNNRIPILSVLYNKIDEKIKEKMLNNTRILLEEINKGN